MIHGPALITVQLLPSTGRRPDLRGHTNTYSTTMEHHAVLALLTSSVALVPRLVGYLLRPQSRPDSRTCIEALDTVSAWDDQAPSVAAVVDGEVFATEAETVEQAVQAVRDGRPVTALKPEGQRQFYRFAAVVAREVKNRMGCPKRTPANWLVAQDLVQKVLAEKHVRKVDRHVFAPLATQMVFVPTKYDVMGRKFAQSCEVAMREAEFDGTRLSWWRRLFGVAGTWKPPNIERG